MSSDRQIRDGHRGCCFGRPDPAPSVSSTGSASGAACVAEWSCSRRIGRYTGRSRTSTGRLTNRAEGVHPPGSSSSARAISRDMGSHRAGRESLLRRRRSRNRTNLQGLKTGCAPTPADPLARRATREEVHLFSTRTQVRKKLRLSVAGRCGGISFLSFSPFALSLANH